MCLVLIPNQSKYYTDGVDLFSLKKLKYFEKFVKHTGWRLTYMNEWRFYIKKQHRGDDIDKLFFMRTELPSYLPENYKIDPNFKYDKTFII